MNWYYLENGAQQGPVSDADLQSLFTAGTVNDATLVWKEGMANWQPYGEVKTPAAPVVRLAAPPPQAAMPDAACIQCGQVLPKDQMIQLGGSWVCGPCKPVYIQKLKEGVAANSGLGMRYAGMGSRLVAKLLDGLIVGGCVAVILGIAFFLTFTLRVSSGMAGRANQTPTAAGGAIMLVVVVLCVLAAWLYMIWCLPKYGATPGKRIMGLRVVTATGGPISWGRSFGRFFAEQLNGFIPLAIGYIIAFFDDQKRTVHDHLAGTRVITIK